MLVLIIDDELDIRTTLRATLAAGGALEVIEAVTGEDGLRLATERRPDLIVLDQFLPGMKGLEVLARLRSEPATATTPIVFLSGDSEARDTASGMATESLIKPFKPAVLRRIVRKLAGLPADRELAGPPLQELKHRFVRNSSDRYRGMERSLELLRAEPSSGDLLEGLMRQFHSLSGSGGTHGFPSISDIARGTERDIRHLLSTGATVTPEQIQQWSGALDRIKRETTTPEPDGSPPIKPVARDAPRSRILLVDADRELSRSIATVLEANGMQCELAGSVSAAMEIIDEAIPNGIICDISLPDGTGYSVIEHLRGSPLGESAAAIVTSGVGSFPDKVEAIRCGADGYFMKPFDSEALVRRLGYLLATRDDSRARVLSVEDDPDQAEYVQSVLESAGYEVRNCDDPRYFEADLISFSPDLVLMDVVLPGMSGFELVRFVRQNEGWATLPIIFLTSETQPLDRIHATRSGGDDYLSKPVSPALLIASVAARVERARFLKRLLEHDGLTGLLTHTAFMDRAKGAMAAARRNGHSIGFVMIDLDHFKRVNDQHGHATGDLVLSSLSAQFRRRLRQSDAIGRYGGEEFALLISYLDEKEAVTLIERLLAEFSATPHKSPGGGTFQVTFSAGIAMLESTYASVDLWKEAADQALYLVKERGRNAVAAVARQNLQEQPHPPGEMIQSDPIDRNVLEELRELGEGDSTFLPGMIQLFLDDTPTRMMSLRDAIAAADGPAIARAAHGLKSSCANIGAGAMSAITSSLESAGKKGVLEEAGAELEKLEAELIRATRALQNELRGPQ